MADKFFQYLNSLSQTKEDKRTDYDFEDQYDCYKTDLFFSLFIDTIMDANRMNRANGLGIDFSKKAHYGYYLNKVRSRKRFSGSWPKRKKDEMIGIIQSYYGYSVAKARQALEVLSEEQIEQIIKKTKNKGGTK